METESYIVYVQTDEQYRITDVNSSAFVSSDWGTHIDLGVGDKYHHAQRHYFDGGVYNDDGIPRYKLEDGKVVERSTDEIDADRAALPKPAPSDSERLAALEAAMLTMMMTGGASHV